MAIQAFRDITYTEFDGSLGGNDIIFAGAGDDLIDARGIGSRLISAGSGNDSILLGAGNALVIPGSGDDVILSDISSFLSYVDAQEQPFQLAIGPGGGCIMAGVISFGQAIITGGLGPNFIAVASLRAELEGTVGVDSATILTGTGNDTVLTLGTNSLIRSGAGDDLLFSGAGDDVLYAGRGNDVINLRGGTVTPPNALLNSSFLEASFLSAEVEIQGGGSDTVYLGGGEDTVVLGSSGFAKIYGFGLDDHLDLSGLEANFIHRGHDTLVNVANHTLAVLKGYTDQVGLV
jgi:Ca2+-binding RTX toxin-like protein